MKAFILQHVFFEGPGYIVSVLKDLGYQVSLIHLYKNEPFPLIQDIDLLVIMGGPMSVNDELQYPFFVEEKKLCREMVSLNKKMVGICLGAQMIASALGGSVYKNHQKEIGWWPIVDSNTKKESMVFHFHGETFDLPTGASLLASSKACINQAFRINHSYGLQFHLEMTNDSLRNIINHCENELVTGFPFIQNKEKIIDLAHIHLEQSNLLMKQFLSFLSQS